MSKLKVLLLTEGYHGMISQVEGMAKALKANFQHKVVRLNHIWNYIPPKLTPISSIILKDPDYINLDENFDLIISCGRKSVVPSIILKRKNNKVLTIQIQNPKVNFKNIDFIIAPEHDNLSGENVITSKGSVHYITLEEIEKAKSYLENKIKGEKLVSLILGGPNKYYSFSNKELEKVFNDVKKNFISKGYKVIIIPSMRTPKRIIDLANQEFDKESLVINNVNKQAYLASIGIAKKFIVTCDSTSMISEVATSGKPIFIAHMRPKRDNYRFKKFFKLFKEMGITRDLGEKDESWTYNKMNEAERIANILNNKINN